MFCSRYALFLFLLHNFHWLSDELLPKCCHGLSISCNSKNAKICFLNLTNNSLLFHSINSKCFLLFSYYFRLSSIFLSGNRVFIEFHSISYIYWNALLQLIESKILLSSYLRHFLLAA